MQKTIFFLAALACGNFCVPANSQEQWTPSRAVEIFSWLVGSPLEEMQASESPVSCQISVDGPTRCAWKREQLLLLRMEIDGVCQV